MSMLAQIMARARAASQRAMSQAQSRSRGEDATQLHGQKELAKTFANYEKENNVAAMLILAEPMAKAGFQKKNIDARIEAARKFNAGQLAFQSLMQTFAPQLPGQPQEQPTTPPVYSKKEPTRVPTPEPKTTEPQIERTPRQEKKRDDLLSRTSLTVNSDGKLSFTISPRKKKTLDQLVEERILGSEHREAIVEALAKRKITGQVKIEEIKSDVTGETSFVIFDADGKQIDETTKVKTDLSAKEKEDTAKRLKLTTVITDIDEATGEQVITKIVDGEPESRERGAKVRIPEAEKTTTATKTRLEQTITEGAENLDRLDEISESYKDWFVTTPGKAAAEVGRRVSRLSGGALQIAPEFRADFEKFKETVRINTLLWRKFITGVAGGEKEFTAIEKAIPNVDVDDPVAFSAKLEQMKSLTKAAVERAKNLRDNFNLDITTLTEEDRAAVLENHPLEVPAREAPPTSREPKVLKFDAQGNRIE